MPSYEKDGQGSHDQRLLIFFLATLLSDVSEVE